MAVGMTTFAPVAISDMALCGAAGAPLGCFAPAERAAVPAMTLDGVAELRNSWSQPSNTESGLSRVTPLSASNSPTLAGGLPLATGICTVGVRAAPCKLCCGVTPALGAATTLPCAYGVWELPCAEPLGTGAAEPGAGDNSGTLL